MSTVLTLNQTQFFLISINTHDIKKRPQRTESVYSWAKCANGSLLFGNFNFVSFSFFFLSLNKVFFVQCDFSTIFFLFSFNKFNVCTMVLCLLHVYHIAVERENDGQRRRRRRNMVPFSQLRGTLNVHIFFLARDVVRERVSVCVCV